jgi:hypothetical protein
VAVAWADSATGETHLRAFRSATPWSFVTPALPLGPACTPPTGVGAICTLRRAMGSLFAVNPAAGTIAAIDPDAWVITRTYEVGAAAAPVDIAVVGPRTAWVTRGTATRLLRLDLVTGATQEMTDLSIFADADGIPDMGTMISHEGRVFVQIRRAGPAGFVRPAMLAVVDAASGDLIDADPALPGSQAIELEGTAARGRMQVIPQTRRLVVLAAGAYQDDGGIEVVNLDSLRTEGLAIREMAEDADVGADLEAITMVSPTEGWLTFTTDFALSAHLHAFTLAGAVDPSEPFMTLGYYPETLLHDNAAGLLYFPHGDFGNHGVYVLDAASGSPLTPTPVATGGPPRDLLLFDAGCGAPGDANGDGRTDSLDASSFVGGFLAGESPCLDLDGSGWLDRTDLGFFAEILLAGP